MVRILLDLAELFLSDGRAKLLRLLPHEGCTPGISPQLAKLISVGLHELVIVFLLAVYILNRVIVHLFHPHHTCCKIAQVIPWPHLRVKETHLTSPLSFVLLLVLAADFLVVTLNRFKSAVGNAVFEQGRSSADQAVATLDMRVEEGERLAR